MFAKSQTLCSCIKKLPLFLFLLEKTFVLSTISLAIFDKKLRLILSIFQLLYKYSQGFQLSKISTITWKGIIQKN